MKESRSSRKGTIINLGTGERNHIPACFENIYKIEETSVTPGRDLGQDETFRQYSLRTILVEGTTVVNNGKAININGEFDIPVFKEDIEEGDLVNTVYSKKEDAIEAWEVLTDSQLNRAIELEEEMNNVRAALQRSRDERQY